MSRKQNYKIEVRICSEAIFSSGEKERNLVHNKVLTDRYGLVYFHAKSLKGQLKRQAFWILRQYGRFDPERQASFLTSVSALFGINRAELQRINMESEFSLCGEGMMKLSSLELDKRIRKYFIALQSQDARDEYYSISPHDLIEAQTRIRTGIQLEDGKAKDKRLTTYHTVKEGLIFYSSLSFDANPVPYLEDLHLIVRSLDRIGAGIHRGRGEVETRLLVDGRDMADVNKRNKEGETACGVI